MILDDIMESKREQIERAKDQLPFEDLKVRLSGYFPERSFKKALRTDEKLSLIAELKRKSPSKKVLLREQFDPAGLAIGFQQAGAAALSVLTDEPFFGGRLDFISAAKHSTNLPVLRKDFIIDPYQLYEAAYYEADAVLLIVKLLPEEDLVVCLQVADTLNLEAIVEVHDEEELKVALRIGAHFIGINHRNLSTLEIDPQVSERLVPHIPSHKTIIAESGIQTHEDVVRMRDLGVHALLIGETLMSAHDPSAKIRELFAGIWQD